MKIDRPLCPEGFGEPYERPEPETPVLSAQEALDALVRGEGHPSLYSPAQRLTLGGRGRRMTRRGVFAMALSAFAALGNVQPALAFFRGGGGVASGGVTLLTTRTLQNPGSTDTNVEVQFGVPLQRGAVLPTGYTFVLKDDLGNTLPMNYMARSDYGAQTASTEPIPSVRHLVFLTIVPSFGASRTISIYKQAGSYSPGTPIAMSAITGSHNFILTLGNTTWPASDCNNNVIGSGKYQFVFNTYAAIPFSANGSGTGIPGGYTQTQAGSVCSQWVVTGAMTDVTGGAPYVHMYTEFHVSAWSNGRVEFMPKLSNPWKNVTTPTPTLYWGDLSLYDGATLLGSLTENYTFGTSAVNLSDVTYLTASGTTGSATGTTAFGGTGFNGSMVGQQLYISNGGSGPGLTVGVYPITGYTSGTSITLASSPGTGTGATWRIGGGSITNPATIQMGEPLVFTQGGGATLPAGITAGALNFAMTSTNGVTWNNIGLSLHIAGSAEEGVGYVTIGSTGSGTNTMTRTCTVNNWQAVYLPSGDPGQPWFLPARIATPYPNLTSAEKLYIMESGMMPAFNLTPPSGVTFPANYMLYGGGSGPSYRPNSLGLEINAITNGGTHNGIGWQSDWSLATWANMTTANWDQTRATALSQVHLPVGNLLNVLTGFIPAFDNGIDQAGGSYPSIGAPFPSDFIYFYNPTGAPAVGFVNPSVPTWILALSSSIYHKYDWWAGVGLSDANEGGITDHHPDMSHILHYLLEGKRWFLDQIRRDANYGLAGTPAFPFNSITDRTVTISGATPTNRYGNMFWIGENPRSTAWGTRAQVHAAVLGANTDPEQIMWWNIFRQQIREVFAIDDFFYGGASSGFGSMGMMSTSGYDSMFMDNYMSLAASNLYSIVDQNEGSGQTTLAIANRCIRLAVGLQTSWGISNYWAPSERVSDMSPYSSTAPGGTFATSLANIGVYYGAPTFDTGGVPVSASGVITVNGWSGTDTLSQYYGNNDQWLPMNAAAVTAFGNGPLYIVNWTPGSPPTCQLASTIGGTPIVPPGAASTLYFAPRPVANPATPLAVGNAQFDPHGYQAQYICSMAAGLAAGLTEPGISAAMTAALTRYTPAGNYGNPPWLEWWMDPTISVVH